MRARDGALLASITLAAALLRFGTLGSQSYWFDESVTVDLVRRPFTGMWNGLEASESTPPLYYVLAWLWSRVFGTGDFALRSLSALAGSTAVPVTYAAATELVSRRAGLLAAALAATSPLLVWYSQEARSYSLLVLLSALSLLFFARAWRRSDRVSFAAWALVSTLAVWTHYFGAFLVAGEAALLLLRPAGRRAALLSMLALGAVVAPLIPIAREQERHGHTAWIAALGLHSRARETGYEFVAGRHALLHGSLVVAALAAVGVAFLVRSADRDEKRGALVFSALAAAALALPLVAAAAGKDYWYYRNVIGAWIPLAIVLSTGLAARRAGRYGLAVGGLLVACSALLTATIFTTERLQRDDWRALAACLGPPSPSRAIVLRLSYEVEALRRYRPVLGARPRALPPVSELVLVGVDDRRPYPVDGFATSSSECPGNIPVVRLTAPRARPVDARAVVAMIPHHDRAAVFVDARPDAASG